MCILFCILMLIECWRYILTFLFLMFLRPFSGSYDNLTSDIFSRIYYFSCYHSFATRYGYSCRPVLVMLFTDCWLLLIKTARCCRIIVSQSWLTCCCLCYFSYHVAASFHSNRLLLLCVVYSMLVSLMILEQHNPPSRAKVEMLKTSNILYIIYAYCIIKSPDCHP